MAHVRSPAVYVIRDTTNPTADVLTIQYNQLKPAQTPEEAQMRPLPVPPGTDPITEKIVEIPAEGSCSNTDGTEALGVNDADVATVYIDLSIEGIPQIESFQYKLLPFHFRPRDHLMVYIDLATCVRAVVPQLWHHCTITISCDLGSPRRIAYLFTHACAQLFACLPHIRSVTPEAWNRVDHARLFVWFYMILSDHQSRTEC
ncbi:uncharacterized protein DEA37_0002178 [Paragonimus westermani]|uniref:Uncharacterized protein n=1 Tax=Paragonimus westermani TaxID=34504 RepID=A0A5J4N718_9TREM|nr:uncharacterized protein DEA37_0002178 [Paragonimus westermani]